MTQFSYPLFRHTLHVRFRRVCVQLLHLLQRTQQQLSHTVAAQLVRESRQLVRQHPRVALAGVAALCTLGAGAAVAMVERPAATQLAVRQVQEAVVPALSYLEQEQQLQQHPLTLYRSTETRRHDTAASLLGRMDIRDVAAEAYIRKTDVVRAEVLGLNQRFVQAEVSANRRLQRLSVIWQNPEQPNQYKKLVLMPDAHGAWAHQFETGDAEVTTAVGYAVMTGAYYRSTRAVGIPSAIADQVLDIFEPQIDMLREIRRNDTVTVVYERLSLDGLDLGTGRVLSASVQIRNKTYEAVWLDGTDDPRRAARGDSGGRYYTPSGEGLSLAYLSSPVPGARITSPFERYRVHPIFGDVRSHTGVDYGAPAGTPIQVVADGVVSFAGWQTGYGNVVIVQHGGKQSTLYAHMSRMLVSNGAKVRQGQIIGHVGSTGWSTGPHLHFETRDNNVPQNPERVLAERRTQSVSVAQRRTFVNLVAQARRSWEQAHSMRLASAR